MAEAVASIIGISHFGGELAHALYKLGVNVASARRQTNKISERMTDYTTVLDILEATLEGGGHIFSNKAEDSILKHCDRSRGLFEEIECLLPPEKQGWGRGELKWVDKFKWNFRRSRVELLLGELEYVKSDIVLILVTQLLGQKIKSYRKSKTRPNKKQHEEDAEAVRRHTTKANNAILQHMNAAEELERLQIDADIEDSSAARPSSELQIASRSSSALTLVSRQNEIIAAFQQALLKTEDPVQRQALVIERSPMLLQDLLMQWTIGGVETAHRRSPPTADTERFTESSVSTKTEPGRWTTAVHQNGPIPETMVSDDDKRPDPNELTHAWDSDPPDGSLRSRREKQKRDLQVAPVNPWLGEAWEINRQRPPTSVHIDAPSTTGSDFIPPKQKLHPRTTSFFPPGKDLEAEHYANVNYPKRRYHINGLTDTEDDDESDGPDPRRTERRPSAARKRPIAPSSTQHKDLKAYVVDEQSSDSDARRPFPDHRKKVPSLSSSRSQTMPTQKPSEKTRTNMTGEKFTYGEMNKKMREM